MVPARLLKLGIGAALAVLVGLAPTGRAGAQEEAGAFDSSLEACFAGLVRSLADDAMEGRGVGTAGLDRAADLLIEELRARGFGDAGVGWQQPLEVVTGVALGPGNALRAGTGDELAVEADFVPLGFSSSGAFDGEVAFVGYGIRAEELGYDDYAGLDVTGRVVLAMRYEPGEDDDASPFDGRRPSRWSDLRYKALIARETGAVALILVDPPIESEGGHGGTGAPEPDRLPRLRSHGPTSAAGLPVLQVTRDVARRWLSAAGLDLEAVQREIDGSYTPRSTVLEGVRVAGQVDVVPTRAPVRNVLGFRPGAGSLAAEVVVVGAHYDHLGYGGDGSRAPDSSEIHNGADDNASGVAAMLCGSSEAARLLDESSRDQRGLLVIGFTAEEMGLGGSGHYVEHPVVPLDRTVAMVNLDMVGRLRDGRLVAMGTETAPEWPGWLEAAAAGTGLSLEMGGDGYGPSDQTSFYDAGIPVLHLFTGAHEEYHTPADDVATVNMEGGAQVAGLLGRLLVELVTRPERPTFVRSSSAPMMAGDSRGYGAYLGTIPDYSAMMGAEGGVLLSGVRAGGPADRAGIRAGDTIVALGGMGIQNLYDLTFALRENRPGETVDIEILRGGERIVVRATLERRGAEEGSGSPHGAHETPTSAPSWSPSAGTAVPELLDAREVHLAELRQLTDGGENAEAYFGPDGRRLIFQRTPPEGGCDQMFVLDLDGGEVTQVSSGRGRTTCGYFSYPAGDRVIYATTELHDPACPAPPDRSAGYVWGLYEFDLVWQDWPAGSPEPFLAGPGYDAEATACMQDGRIVFTSTRDGDLELYVGNADGSDLRRLTSTPGYDGGAFFTPDCSRIVWRASRPEGDALAEYRDLLGQGLVRPSALEIYAMNADGSDVRQLTHNGAANFAPYPTPDGAGVLYSSNAGGSAREFDLWRVGFEGGEPEQVTFTPAFDGFPMFSPDGQWLVFASNRGGEGNETNLFIARWVP